VAKIPPKDKTKPQNREELEEIFEKTLRPLQSHNARHIFLMLRDSETEYLTTYDMQHMLEEQGNKLSKVELNNWLSALQDAGLVQKAPDRGKPTTMPYNRRYTFDLWKLTQKGRETSHMLEGFRGNTPIQTIEKVVEKSVEKTVEIPKLPELMETSFEDHEKIQTLSIHLGLLKALKETEPVDIMSLSEQTGLTPKMIVKFIEYQERSSSNTLYFLREIPMDLREKILQIIGWNPRKNYSVSLSPEGKAIAAFLFP
jgi:DNA-binding transcriptional ArsR family regulator